MPDGGRGGSALSALPIQAVSNRPHSQRRHGTAFVVAAGLRHAVNALEQAHVVSRYAGCRTLDSARSFSCYFRLCCAYAYTASPKNSTIRGWYAL